MIRMREIKSVWLAESVAENVGTHAGTSDFVSLGNTCVHTDARTHATMAEKASGNGNPGRGSEGVTCGPASLGRLPPGG